MMKPWEDRMQAARAMRDQMQAAGELSTPMARIVAYNTHGSFLDNLALMVALDEQRQEQGVAK